ncbi:MAG: chitobiase/beta-hexosaminidase C-terminal domain-containing protein [Planctomycetota bacterium]|nr:chitobiase/beta-hexosaminidase C-terminal domain-containing protein [Planctomycetota bacterium]
MEANHRASRHKPQLIKQIALATALLLASPAVLHAADAPTQSWKPAKPVLMTRWGKTVTPENVLPEYPRPQMVRREWQNLNGLWEFAVGAPDDAAPVGKTLARRILVPFPMESALSGIGETAECVWYRRTFEVPAGWKGQRALLHFGAVDWETTVFVNGKEAGKHSGGYDPFTFDITDALTPGGPQELIVRVSDPMMPGQAGGKQSRTLFLKPRGSIFYSCVTGIWQTVWLEPVPAVSIQDLQLTPDVDAAVLRVKVAGRGGAGNESLEVVTLSQGREVGRATGKPGEEITVPVRQPRLWSPDDPFLYDLKVTLQSDVVESYFAMRKVSIGKDERGITRILLNNKFTFMMGSLDQGFWPDGIYTAPTDEALRFDIDFAKRIGLNLARKHVKVEPERWYYWCDKLGLLVWQDMPAFSTGVKGYEEEMPRIIAARRNHPCIVLWIMQNETFCATETLMKAVAVAKQSDPTRPATAVSGCPDFGIGDIKDRHHYSGPSSYTPTDRHHDWFEIVLKKTYPAWPAISEQLKLDLRHEQHLQALWQLVHTPGLSGSAWTQLTDIEGECNGFITYDREVIKNNVARIAAANRGYVAPAALPDVRFDAKSDDSLHGIFVDTQTVTLVTPRPEAEIRYTLDGSEPNANSPRYAQPIVLTGTTAIKAKSFWPDYPPSITAEFLYRKVTEFQPGAACAKLEPGVSCQYFRQQQVIASATLPGIAFHPAPPFKRQPMDRYMWKGVICIPREGLYTFTRPAAEMKFTIGWRIVFPGHGGRSIHVGDWESPGQIALQAGCHRIEAEWIISPATQYFVADCAIQIEGPGVEKQPIPAALLKHEIPQR